MKLSRNRRRCLRTLLGSELLELAQINLKAGAYKEAAASALELPNVIPLASRDRACFDAARVLARLVTQANSDTRLSEDVRNQFTRNYLGRTIVLLREAIDTNPKLAGQIKSDPDIKALESRPEFRSIMNTLVDTATR